MDLCDAVLSYKAFIDKIFEYDCLHKYASPQPQPQSQPQPSKLAIDEENEEEDEDEEEAVSDDLIRQLEAILARLVSNYRAIFAIEERVCLIR